MSLVSNFIGGVGVNNLGNNSNPLKFDPNNTEFEDLLKKQLETNQQSEFANSIGTLGIPAGFEIGNPDGTNFAETAQDQIEAVGEKLETQENTSNLFDTNGDNNVTTSEAVTFFTSLLDNNESSANSHSQLFDFAKKQAFNFYNKYSKNVVTDINEFVNDVKNMISQV